MKNIFEEKFKKEYAKLNARQKEAVDWIEGPVMVVAGPGTGKTEILALRIGNILKKTDTPPDAVLCLTFTNSGVRAMRERLSEYMGTEGERVLVSTFHSFVLRHLLEKYYHLLDFKLEPKILSDEEAVLLCDEILRNRDWEHIRPRGNPEMYFSGLKQLISVLKRARLSPEEFMQRVEEEIQDIKNDPENISSRGQSKGKIKKEAEKKMESLERTKEVVEFYRLYEEQKRESGLVDYDDVLEYAVQLVEEFEEVRAEVRENYQYVLVDEHQDSSGVQNAFLSAVWREVEKPNIFVVGDDRQLIYGFSGASLSYFEEFSDIFKGTKLITLTENYRSARPILALAEDLLKSKLSPEGLSSAVGEKAEIVLGEYAYPRDEIIGAGLYFKKLFEKEKAKPEECAILVPRNYQVRDAVTILENMGIPASAGKNLSLFEAQAARSLLLVLSIIAAPYDSILLSESLLDRASRIMPMQAHKFLKNIRPEKLSIEEMRQNGKMENKTETLFGKERISEWGETLFRWVDEFGAESLTHAVSSVGRELLINRAQSHEELLRNVEVVRTFLRLAEHFSESRKNPKLADFLSYLKRLDSYGSHISLSAFESGRGVRVMTLHKSKGLQYRAVWIAHMNQEILMSEKRTPFTLPEKVKGYIQERSAADAKRELYVAITRAKEFCLISYAREDYRGSELEPAEMIVQLPEKHFQKKNAEETEKEILAQGPASYVPANPVSFNKDDLEEVRKFVKENYFHTKISVTLLNNFFECPWKWYFRSFLKLPERKTKSLALGSAVHAVIEAILKNKQMLGEEIIIKKLEEVIQKEDAQATLAERSKMLGQAKKAISRFARDFYPKLSKEYLSERPLSFRDPSFPELLMYGKLDLSERTGPGEITVTDFKTGAAKTKGTIEKLDEENRLSGHMRQLSMYSYLVRGAEKGTEVALSRLFYLEAPEGDRNAIYETKITGEQIDLLLRDIKDYREWLKSGEWTERPCYNKLYGRGEVCQYCRLAEIYRSDLK